MKKRNFLAKNEKKWERDETADCNFRPAFRLTGAKNTRIVLAEWCSMRSDLFVYEDLVERLRLLTYSQRARVRVLRSSFFNGDCRIQARARRLYVDNLNRATKSSYTDKFERIEHDAFSFILSCHTVSIFPGRFVPF